MAPGRPTRVADPARTVSAWGPVILYMAAIFVVSGQQHVSLGGRLTFSDSDKLLHACAYFGLALVAYRAAAMVPLTLRLDPAVVGMIISALYGVTDEFHQHFVPGRSTDVFDLLADAAGALIAMLTIKLIRHYACIGGMKCGRRRERL